MLNLAINDLPVISEDFPTLYRLEGIEGLDDPDRRIASYDLPGSDGGYIGSSWYGLRGVTITGGILASDPYEFSYARSLLVQACRLKRDSYGLPVPTTVTLKAFDGRHYVLSGQIKSVKIAPINRKVASFIITMVCPDPNIYNPTIVTSGTITRPTGGAVIFPLSFPSNGVIMFGSAAGGAGSLTNDGEADTWPVLTLTGLLTNPSVYHLESGTTFQLNYVLGVGDVVKVDMAAKSVVINNSGSILGTKTIDSDWFALAPGPNTFRLSSGSTADTGSLVVTAYSAFLAVQ